MLTCVGANQCPSIFSLGGIVIAASFIHKNKLLGEVVFSNKDLIFVMAIFIVLYCRLGYLWDIVAIINTTSHDIELTHF